MTFRTVASVAAPRSGTGANLGSLHRVRRNKPMGMPPGRPECSLLNLASLWRWTHDSQQYFGYVPQELPCLAKISGICKGFDGLMMPCSLCMDWNGIQDCNGHTSGSPWGFPSKKWKVKEKRVHIYWIGAGPNAHRSLRNHKRGFPRGIDGVTKRFSSTTFTSYWMNKTQPSTEMMYK